MSLHEDDYGKISPPEEKPCSCCLNCTKLRSNKDHKNDKYAQTSYYCIALDDWLYESDVSIIETDEDVCSNFDLKEV